MESTLKTSACRTIGAMALAAGLSLNPAAYGEQGAGKWEIGFHAGSFIHYQTRSSRTLPPPAQPYAAFIRPVLEPSRRVSSWYFGDGTMLFNAAAERVGPTIPKIIPLDPILTSSVAKPGGAAFGFRVSRRITRRAAAEFSIEHGGELSISDQGLSRIDASRSSFASAFGSVTSVAANSRSTIKEHGAPLTLSTGALIINTPGFGRIRSFLTVGAGVLSTGRETPNASIVGSYDPGPSVSMNLSDVITDTVKLDFAPSKHQSFAALLGGGIKVPMNSRWGIRVDFGAYLYRNPITTSLTAVHTDPQTVAFIVADDPRFIQFWAVIPIGSPVGAPAPPGPVSSLSGPAIFGLKSFTETGLQSQIRISVGPYWRF